MRAIPYPGCFVKSLPRQDWLKSPIQHVELGFLTNPGEEDFLQSTQGKELLASAIYRAVKEYKFKREQRDAGIQTEASSLPTAVESPITGQSNSPGYCSVRL